MTSRWCNLHCAAQVLRGACHRVHAVSCVRPTSLLLALCLHWTLTTEAVSATLNQCIRADGRVEFTDQTCPSDAISKPIQNNTHRDGARSENGSTNTTPAQLRKRPNEATITSALQNLQPKRLNTANGLPAEDRLKSCNPAIAMAAADEIVNHPANLKEPLQLFSAAFVLFQNGRKDEGVFWFYAAQLRTRQQIVLEQGDRGQLLTIMLMTMGPFINNYAFQNTENLNRILDRVLEWDRTVTNPFQEKARLQKLDREINHIYGGLTELKTKLLADKSSLETAARQAAASIEKMHAQTNNQRCREDQPDPAFENQTIEREWVQATEFIKANKLVILKVGSIKHVGRESSKKKPGEALPSRYIASVGGDTSTYAVIDVSRSSGNTQFSLACFTQLPLGGREPFKDECKQ